MSTYRPTAREREVLAAIERFNTDDEIDAFLVQVPLPKGLDEEAALFAVDPEKDVDGLHPVNLGRLVMGSHGPIPCTPAGILELLVHHDVPIEGRHVVIIGRGLDHRPPARAVARAQAPQLQRRGHGRAHGRRRSGRAHASGRHPGRRGRRARAGHARHGKPGAAVVGAGVTMDGKRIISDVVDEVAEVAGWMTHRSGASGP